MIPQRSMALAGALLFLTLSVAAPAAEPEKALNPQLVNMPANTWLHLKPDRNPAGRNYSGLCAGGGYIFYFGGGHFGHPGNDVDLYDIAANKWIQATEMENFNDADQWTHLPEAERAKLKKVIGGGSSGTWLSPKGRPLTAHTYQMQVWFPEEKAFYFGTYYLWAFYPDKRGPGNEPPLPWKKIADSAPRGRDIHTWNMNYDPELKTIFRIVGTAENKGVHIYDRAANSWTKKYAIPTAGEWTEVYSTYDSTRKLHVVHCGDRKNSKSSWWTLDLAGGQTKFLKDLDEAREAAKKPAARTESLSMEYDPATRTTLAMVKPGKGGEVELWAHDPEKDDWTELRLAGQGPGATSVVSWEHLVYDEAHKCHLFVNQITPNNNARCDGLFAFRLDPKGLQKVEPAK